MKYISPEINIVLFDTQDYIVASAIPSTPSEDDSVIEGDVTEDPRPGGED